MDSPKRRTPAGPGEGFDKSQAVTDRLPIDSTALKQAAATSLARELWIIQTAARQVANYHALPHDDYERVDQAAGRVLAVLAVLMDREVAHEL